MVLRWQGRPGGCRSGPVNLNCHGYVTCKFILREIRVPMHNTGAALIFYVQSRWKAPTVWDGWFFPNPGLFRKSKFRIWWLFTLRAIGIKIERRKNLTGSTKKRNCLSFKSILILSFHQINKPPLHKLKCTEHWSGKRLEHQGQESGKYCLCVFFWEICHAHEWIWNWSKRT